MAGRMMTFVTLAFGFFCLPVYSARMFDRRSDLTKFSPYTLSGLTVPLEGGQPCVGDYCPTLSPPAENKTLEMVALGRGSFNYTCEGADPTDAPTSVEQYTELYDVSTIAPAFDQDYLQQLVQQLYDFDYGEGKNNSLDCIGSIGTFESTAVVTLYEVDVFEAYVLETLPSPGDPDTNGPWAHSRSTEFEWEMYRVEVVGGKVPATCDGLAGSFDIQYAAEYWFYRG